MDTRKRRHTAILLLALFMAYSCCNTLFVHSHYCQDGWVTHSHPYLPGSHHSHSVAALEAIGVLQNWTSGDVPVVLQDTDVPETHPVIFGTRSSVVTTLLRQCFLLRAPPCRSLS